jgi:demethylmenaquinone methyltransferase/2-methoxy-6-polyprenyl-1,4-benzoquinol methylase
LIAQPLKQTARRIFGGLYSSYDWVLDYFTLFQDRYWKRWLLARASLSSDDLVLDIGCGTGVLEEKFAPDANVVGIDLSDEMLEIARSKHLSGLLSCYAVKYCDLNKFVAQTFRVLKPGGRLVIYDFARPRGLLGPLHFFYIYGVFRLLGLLTKRYDTGMSITFSELPQIIARTHWFEELGLALQNEGFEGCSNRFLSGGGVAIFWARKPCNRSEL